ncbi:hypothetical protein [Noviherbaspirillum pedocola]|uniref:Lipoprotein n=1 Tax=Noviherbaspirillum pedocola TaxID=2801341 RepID=A0A934SVH7_9BURK|nr:hypothetical protein [Noviherbaspirillum pedocola]MBK4736175.1 hypothetical protein [Noviherbaspirillum pedocola]
MRVSGMYVTAVSAMLLCACGNKTDANDANFSAVVSQQLAKSPDVCAPAMEWPVDITDFDQRVAASTHQGKAVQMAALEQAGLTQSTDALVDQPSMSAKPLKAHVRRYSLTDAAKPFTREQEIRSMNNQGSMVRVKASALCFAKVTLDKVQKWDQPMKLGSYEETSVFYTYRLNDIAEWSKRPDIQAAYPPIKKVLDGSGTLAVPMRMKLTNQGWEAL